MCNRCLKDVHKIIDEWVSYAHLITNDNDFRHANILSRTILGHLNITLNIFLFFNNIYLPKDAVKLDNTGSFKAYLLQYYSKPKMRSWEKLSLLIIVIILW